MSVTEKLRQSAVLETPGQCKGQPQEDVSGRVHGWSQTLDSGKTSEYWDSDERGWEAEELRIAQLARDIRAGKEPTFSLEQVERELGLEGEPVDHSILDEIQ